MPNVPATDVHSQYKRAYKACEACRRTKTKCELADGAVDCVKCQRERRDCLIPAERSTKRRRTSTDDTQQRDRRDQQSVRPASQHTPGSTDRHAPPPPPPPPPPQGSAGRGASPDVHTALDRHPAVAANLETDVVQTIVTSSRDAMGLLFGAAGRDSTGVDDIDAELDPTAELDHAVDACGGMGTASPTTTPRHASSLRLVSDISPGILELWERHRFVVQGWFSAYEAVSLLNFFFEQLAPLSPVAQSFSDERDNHKKFVIDEPLLCCTILCIASRYCPLPGSAGIMRASFVHSRLWRHIEHLVQRITFGSEKYSAAKSRTLGSVQALLLIVEWHPRALHFPPENDGWDASLAPSFDDSYPPTSRNSDAIARWREDVFEPAKRSDRLSWMLVGLAMTLAHELGCFDYAEDESATSSEASIGGTRMRIRRLLFLYTSQLSLRLGCTNIFPQGTQTGYLAGTARSSPSQKPMGEDPEAVLTAWIGITRLLTTATHMFFASKSTTKQILASDRYIDLIQHFKPLLAKWYSEYMVDSAWSPTCKSTRQMLLIEYNYVRVFVSSVAIQALVERVGQLHTDDIWLNQEVARRSFSQDLRFINDARESSGKVLIAATELAESGDLRLCPVRLFLRVVAASIFLLKALALGTREADANTSLDQLDRCIEALLAKGRADDIHLSSRYAELLRRHVRRFKRNFRCRGTAQAVHTTQGDRTGSGKGTNLAAPDVLSTVQNQTQHQGKTSTAVLENDFTRIPVLDSSVSTDGFDFAGGEAPFDLDRWFAQCLDPQVAPYNIEAAAPASDLAVDSLDFLWTLPNI